MFMKKLKANFFCSSRKSGFSIVQVIVAAAMVSGLALVMIQLGSQLNKSNYASKKSSVAMNFESIARAAFTSTQAMSHTRVATPTLNSCFSLPGCAPSAAMTPMNFRDASNAVIANSTASANNWVYVNDQGNVCTPSAAGSACPWKIQATYQSICPSSAPCVPQSFKVRFVVSWNGKNQGDQVLIMKDRELALDLPRNQFITLAAGAVCGPNEDMKGNALDGSPICVAKSSTSGPDCSSTQEMYGINSDGSPKCRNRTPAKFSDLESIEVCVNEGDTLTLSYAAQLPPSGGTWSACMISRFVPSGSKAVPSPCAITKSGGFWNISAPSSYEDGKHVGCCARCIK